MEILKSSINSIDLDKIANHLKSGSLVVFPFDTVYVLAVDPSNPIAVKKLLNFKNRWPGKAISIAVSDIKMAKDYVILNKKEENICSNILPGPFTLVLPGLHRLAPGIEAEDGTLGIRIPDFAPVLNLVKILGRPITATSANLSGRSPHYSIKSFLNTLSQKKKDQIDLIVDLDQLPKNKPSTVIDLTGSELKILRPGTLNLANPKTLISKSEKETRSIAKFLFNKTIGQSTKPIIFLLSGELGCGKTIFSKQIGKLYGVEELITSPTFSIFNEYPISNSESKKFLHFDLYRIKNEFELKEINFFGQFTSSSLSCIEWPENMGRTNLEKLKKDYYCVQINFSYLDPTTRSISFEILN